MSPSSRHVDPYRCYLCTPDPEGLAKHSLSDSSLLDVYTEPGLEADVRAELSRLLAAYEVEAFFGQRHCAPDPAWRDEVVQETQGHARFAIRLHLFEKIASGTPGRYLGFVSLRPPPRARLETAGTVGAHPVGISASPASGEGFRYVIEAELVPPRRMLRPRYHVITTTATAPRLGVLPFRSALFVPPRLDEPHRSTCLHLALSQALHLSMGRFNTKPMSQREFDALIWKMDGNTRSLQDITSRGVDFQEALQVLTSQRHAGGFIASFTRKQYGSAVGTLIHEAHRCLTDCLANGLCVIGMVGGPSPGSGAVPSHPHAVLILGMHLLHAPHELASDSPELSGYAPGVPTREDVAELPGQLVRHDVLEGPFREFTIAEFFEWSLAVGNPDDPHFEPGIHFLVVGPEGLSLGLHTVRRETQRLTLRHYGDILREYAGSIAPAAKDEPVREWRYVTRLMQEASIRAHLLDRPNADRGLTPPTAEELAGRLKWTRYFWSIEVRYPSPLVPFGRHGILPALTFVWPCSLDSSRTNGEDPGVPDPLFVLRSLDGVNYASAGSP